MKFILYIIIFLYTFNYIKTENITELSINEIKMIVDIQKEFFYLIECYKNDNNLNDCAEIYKLIIDCINDFCKKNCPNDILESNTLTSKKISIFKKIAKENYHKKYLFKNYDSGEIYTQEEIIFLIKKLKDNSKWYENNNKYIKFLENYSKLKEKN